MNAGNQVDLGGEKYFVRNNRTRQIPNLLRERNVWTLDFLGNETRWRSGRVEFSEPGSLRTHSGTTVTTTGTGSCKTTAGSS